MTAVYSFAQVSSAVDAVMGSDRNNTAVPSPITTTTVVPPLAGLQPSTAANRNTRLLDAARTAPPTLLAEIDAAAPHLNIPRDHAGWRDEWMFRIATAIRRMPRHERELRAIFDRENRRSAEQAKVAEHGGSNTYFAKALKELDHAIANPPDGEPRGEIGIIFGALDNSWNGLTAAHQAVGAATLRPAAGAVSTTVVTATPFSPTSAAPPAFFACVRFAASALRPVSWLVPGLLMRGEITVVAGQGGGAKTAFAVNLATGLAAGRTNIGPFNVISRDSGLRVGIVSAEEDSNRLGLLTAAAANVLALDAAERAKVDQNLFQHDAQTSGFQIGQPRPGQREDIAPADSDVALSDLSAALAGVDVLVLDTMAALFALSNENDNNLITSLMRRLTAAARQADCAVLLLHHTPKMTRDVAAANRGEATLVRGGSAIVNSARVVLTITAPPDAEAVTFVMQNLRPDQVRRLEHVKINDSPPMEPAYFAIISEKVKVHDGSECAVRAIEFIKPPAASGSFTDADRNVVMKAIDAGVQDDHGARVPLSPSSAGRDSRRDPIRATADALRGVRAALSEAQAKHLAREILKDLRERIGCVVEQDVELPKYTDGRRDGHNTRRGLVCRWQLAPWQVPAHSSASSSVAPTMRAPAVPTGTAPEQPINRSIADQRQLIGVGSGDELDRATSRSIQSPGGVGGIDRVPSCVLAPTPNNQPLQ